MSRSPSLEALRAQIDQLDEQLVRLLNRRAGLAVKVGHVKARAGQGAAKYAPEREKRVLQRLARLNDGPLRPQHLRMIFREVMSGCLALEQPLRIAYMGPAGTYSQQAAAEQFGSGAALRPYASIDAVFDEVERGRAEYGVVPVENSTEGVVAQTLDRFISSPLAIKAEVLLRIDHCLMARDADPRHVRRIVSHPQSLAQCRGWLGQHFAGVPVEEMASNAAAAAYAARHPGAAAIAGRRAAERYKLKVVAESIQDLPNNVTRFLVISNDVRGKSTGDDKTSILFAVPHESGALFKVLASFAQQRINLSTIESRPLKGRAWEYVFFIDLSGHADEPRMAKALAALRRRALFVKVLGSYPAWRWPEGEAKP
ncbi:MAG: prephenate dehydratase [Candidatus Binatia bacterium]